jgi:hypothetical protein
VGQRPTGGPGKGFNQEIKQRNTRKEKGVLEKTF